MEDKKLRDFFKFDEADLKANRSGQFSEKQLGMLKQASDEFGRDMRRTAIPFVFVAAVGIVAAILGRGMGLLWILIWGVGWTLLWGVIGWGFIEGSFTKRKYKLGHVQGRVKIGLKEGIFNFKARKSQTWGDLAIGNKRFEVKSNIGEMFTRGDEYIVYYEKGSNTIVSLEFISAAERLASDMNRLSHVDLEEEARKLRKHFSFTEADLMSNQRGMLSEKQMKRTTQEEKGGRLGGVLIGVFLLLFPIFFTPMVIASIKDLTQIQGIWAARVLWITLDAVFGLVLLALGAAGIFLIVSQFIGKVNFKLLSVRGRANLIRGFSDRHSRVYYDLNVGGVQFDGDNSMHKVIIQDAEYIVYYLEGVYRIMSIELVSVD